jgi:hypothetical protein
VVHALIVLLRNMTPDGISTAEWNRVHAVAVDIVNATGIEDDVLCAYHTERLFDILDELEAIYGRIPSILDTRADYSDDPTVAVTLYEEALSASADPDLTSLVLPSLIRLKIQERHAESSISDLLLELEQLTVTDRCSFEVDELRALQSDFEELKKQNKPCEATGDNVLS